MRWFLAGLLALPLVSAANGADALQPQEGPALCSLGGGGPRFSIARTQDIVAEAEAIVRASALGGAADVSFAVDEVLRGRDVPDTLRFTGVTRDEDSVPPELVDEVPHRSYIRRWGGDCLAMTYKAGGEYLLLLQHSDQRGTLDPYWAVLAPTNNQIRGEDDPWLRWVRAEIVRNPVGGREPPTGLLARSRLAVQYPPRLRAAAADDQRQAFSSPRGGAHLLNRRSTRPGFGRSTAETLTRPTMPDPLGLESKVVRLVPYDRRWPGLFQDEAERVGGDTSPRLASLRCGSSTSEAPPCRDSPPSRCSTSPLAVRLPFRRPSTCPLSKLPDTFTAARADSRGASSSGEARSAAITSTWWNAGASTGGAICGCATHSGAVPGSSTSMPL